MKRTERLLYSCIILGLLWALNGLWANNQKLEQKVGAAKIAQVEQNAAEVSK